MRADVVLIRLIFTAILVIAGYKLAPVRDDPWFSAAAGALIAICIIVFELRIRRATLKTLIGAAVGSILGIIGAYLIGSLISRQESAALEAFHENVLNVVPDVFHGICRVDGRGG